MNILVNRKIKHLFLCVVLTITAFTSVSIIPVYMGIENTALYIVLAAVLMASTILSTLYWYFQGQKQNHERRYFPKFKNILPETGTPALPVMMKESYTGYSMRLTLL